jgi:hypothetical protein
MAVSYSLPPYLKDLFEQSVKDLSLEQGSKVKHLLQTFSHIFAKDDADFGRMNHRSLGEGKHL